MYNIISILSVSLQKIVSGGDKLILIDCAKILKADIRGLQMLYIWIQSAKSRGVEAELINLSRSLQQTMKRMGFDNCFKIIINHKATPVFIKKQGKIIIMRERRADLCLSM
jgi:anti-anti-sigma regulatory factor